MSTAELRRRIKKEVDTLAPGRLQSAADYLAFLEQASGDRATRKNGARANLKTRLAQAERDIATGKLTPVSKLRRKS